MLVKAHEVRMMYTEFVVKNRERAIMPLQPIRRKPKEESALPKREVEMKT